MQQCTAQQQRLQQVLSLFVDYVHGQVVKPYTALFLKSSEARCLEAELVLSNWMRSDAIEQTLAPLVALYLQNDLIQFKLYENIKIIMRTIAALGTANVNLQLILERAIAPMALLAVEKLLAERLMNLNPTGDKKDIKKGGGGGAKS
jgi:hypothetical protein